MRQRRSKYSSPTSPKSAPPKPSSSRSSPFNFNALTAAILGGIFVLGLGVGIAFGTSTGFSSGNMVTRLEIDQQAPNAEICMDYGASAVVTDMRVFLTMNPFSVYVTQPTMRPGCVLRRSNWEILEQRNLVNSGQVRDCRRRLNTFGFTGNLKNSPNVNCVYQNDAAKNLFLEPGAGGPRPETENF